MVMSGTAVEIDVPVWSQNTLLNSEHRFPFYFELKIAFVIWLLSPYTKGSSVLYRKFVHPTLSNKEKVPLLPLYLTW
ncbi:Receptor expression-enhancing protein 2 [Bagarius yarrelli]|uniref:Receptor expression-enhancing protein n=1 Tax=Bagarius yarrelli TaxID=175774 RepID=A0A556V5P4_BAGYA|nr:Receptor expression-enhancing protein 2 [Bagarius yarrelli]